MNVLFTGGGRRVELLRAFLRARRSLGLAGKIVASDVDPLAPAFQVADVSVLVPRSDDPGYIPRLLEVCREHSVDVVFPVIDPDIPLLAQAAGEFQALGVRVGVMGSQSAQAVSDKWLTAKVFAEAGVPAPYSWLPEDLPDAESISFPLHLKPRQGSASKHTNRVDTWDELQYLLERTPQPVIEQYLDGPEVTCDLAYDFAGRFLGMCQRRRIEVRSGEVQKGVTVWHPDIAEYCLKTGECLKARGPITIQCLFHEGVPRFTEVNGRFGGGLPLAVAAGLDFPAWYLALVTGRQPDLPAPGEYRRNLFMTRCDESFFLDPGSDQIVTPILGERGPWLQES